MARGLALETQSNRLVDLLESTLFGLGCDLAYYIGLIVSYRTRLGL